MAFIIIGELITDWRVEALTNHRIVVKKSTQKVALENIPDSVCGYSGRSPKHNQSPHPSQSSPGGAPGGSQTLSDLKKQRSMSRVKHQSSPQQQPLPTHTISPPPGSGNRSKREQEQYELNKKQHRSRNSRRAEAEVIEEESADKKFSAHSANVENSRSKTKGCCRIM